MRRGILGLAAAAVLAIGAAAPALAAPPVRFTEPIPFLFPDLENGLVVLVNMDRETYCTPEEVAWEEAFLAWLEGGEVGDPPEPPAEPDGFAPVAIQQKETRKGAVVERFRGSRLVIEIWELDADAPLIGPCTDTDDALHLIGSGTATFMGNDNDLFGSGTRGNAFGNRGMATIVDDDGNRFRYSWWFHVNSRCHAPDDGPPACLLEGSRLQAR
jgi:hypothetical protein